MTTTTVAMTQESPGGLPAAPAPGLRRALWVVWGVALALGAVGLWQRVTQGHLPAGYGSYVPWGLWVALYFHGVGIAGGVFALGAGGFILDVPGLRSRAALRTTILLSVAALLPGLLAVGLDLGHMDRAAAIFTRPRFSSMMAFNAWMYNAYLVLALGAWALSFKAQSLWLKPLLCGALLFSLLFPSQSGAFFGVVDAKPYWHSALLPILFLVSALTAGAATLLAVRALQAALRGASGAEEDAERAVALRLLRLVALGGLALYFVLEFAEFSIGLWNPHQPSGPLELVLWGPYWWVFWGVHLLLGGVVAGALLLSARPRLQLAGALLAAVCLVTGRLNVLIPGQAVAELQGLQAAFHHPRLSYIYHATLMEYLVAFALLAVGMAVFFVGRRAERLVETRVQGGGL